MLRRGYYQALLLVCFDDNCLHIQTSFIHHHSISSFCHRSFSVDALFITTVQIYHEYSYPLAVIVEPPSVTFNITDCMVQIVLKSEAIHNSFFDFERNNSCKRRLHCTWWKTTTNSHAVSDGRKLFSRHVSSGFLILLGFILKFVFVQLIGKL